MTDIDLSDPSGFNEYWTDTVDAFREVAIDGPLADPASNLTTADGDPVLNAHVTGPVSDQNLAAQYAFPIAWSVPEGHTPSYDTVSTDQGDIRMRVVTFAADTDPDRASKVARALGGRIVDNVEANRSLVVDGDVHAEGTFLTEFQADFRITSGNERAQVKYCQMFFDIGTKRRI